MKKQLLPLMEALDNQKKSLVLMLVKRKYQILLESVLQRWQ